MAYRQTHPAKVAAKAFFGCFVLSGFVMGCHHFEADKTRNFMDNLP